MKSIVDKINEGFGVSGEKYEIYFHYGKKAILINYFTNEDVETDLDREFKSIEDAIKAIYEFDEHAQISIIPSKKLVDFILK